MHFLNLGSERVKHPLLYQSHSTGMIFLDHLSVVTICGSNVHSDFISTCRPWLMIHTLTITEKVTLLNFRVADQSRFSRKYWRGRTKTPHPLLFRELLLSWVWPVKYFAMTAGLGVSSKYKDQLSRFQVIRSPEEPRTIRPHYGGGVGGENSVTAAIGGRFLLLRFQGQDVTALTLCVLQSWIIRCNLLWLPTFHSGLLCIFKCRF